MNNIKTTLLFSFLFFMLSFFANAQTPFTASKLKSDSKIEIEWNIKLILKAQSKNPPGYIQIREKISGKEVYAQIIDSIYNYNNKFIIGNVTTYIRPNSKMKYEFRVLQYGNGDSLMASVIDSGTTLPFQKPTLLGSIISPWQIVLNINSRSDYNQKMYLYRNDSIIAILDTATNSFIEICDPNNRKSIQNGKSYTYKLLAINNTFKDSAFSTTTVNQSTYLVGFKAADKSINDKVRLSWNNLSAYVNKIIVVRDGISLVELNGQDQYFDDLTAVPGYKYIYSLELYEDDVLKITLKDTGSLIANGKISGFVYNNSADNFTIPNVKITAKGTVASVPVTLITYTNANGYYEFKEVAYFTQTDFVLEASFANQKETQSVKLSLDEKSKSQNFALAAPKNEVKNANHTVTNFAATSIDSLSLVRLSWNTTGSDTIHYLIYRGDELIKTGYQVGIATNTFEDLGGVPFAEHEYSIKTYTRKYSRSSKKFDYKFASTLSSKARYPYLFAVKNGSFTVNANITRAYIDLSWKHPKGNIDGFNIYRDNIIIATLPKTASSFIDLTGANNTFYIYGINSFKKRSDTGSYNSAKLFANTTKYPSLSKPNEPTFTSTNKGFVKVSWAYPVSPSYNYDGFTVLRTLNGTTENLGSIRKSLAMEFVDETGIPATNYSYSIQAYKTNILSKSLPSDAAVFNYPALPKVIVLSASGIKEGLVDFKATVNSNYDYLEIAIKNINQTTTYSSYIANKGGAQIPWNNYTAGVQTFALTAVKTINGVKYYGSDTTQRKVTIVSNGTYALQSVTNLEASTTNASHVKISWDYPNFFIPTFYIYRDGVLLDLVEGVQKNYYDHNVPDNELHLYQVQVKLDTRKSKFEGVYGQKLAKTMVYGTVYKEHGKEGIPNAKVNLYLPNASNKPTWAAATTTNSSGYYEFKNVKVLGLNSGTSKITLKAAHPNASLVQDSLSTVYYKDKDAYIVDFKDTLHNPTILSDTITWIKDLMAIANENNQTVELRWQTTNANFTSFEVFRGLVKIATVPASQSKLVIDNKGVAGYDYGYRIQPIWQKDRFTKIEGKMFGVAQRFPALMPVSDLTAAILNDVVRINWNHNVNSNIAYEVLRNNDLFAIVKPNTRLEVIDSFGTVGSVYKYTITPYLADNKNIRAEEKSVIAVFPAVNQIKIITARNVANGMELEWNRPSIRTTHYKIYVNDRLVDTLKTSANGLIIDTTYQGIPGASNIFSIAPGYLQNGQLFFGKRTSVTAVHSSLVSVTAMTVSTFAAEDRVQMEVTNATYPHKGIDGIEFQRIYVTTKDTVVIGNVKFNNKTITGSYLCSDGTGVPQRPYTYRPVAHSTRNGVRYTAINVIRTLQFPRLSPPTQVVATNIKGQYNTIQWKHSREDVTINLSSVLNNISTINMPSVDGTLNQTIDERSNVGDSMYYIVQASLRIGTTTYFSNSAKSNTILLSNVPEGHSIYATGANSDGGLGINSTRDTSRPTLIGKDKDWLKVAAGEGHTMAIKVNGTLWAWGRNIEGQLGIGSNTSSLVPVQVGRDSNWLDVVCGQNHTIALQKRGTLWTWGENDNGQLGLGTYDNRNTPQQQGGKNGYSGWRSIGKGKNNTYAIDSDGSLYGCGDNSYNQIASTGSNFTTFRRISSASYFTKVDGGNGHVAAISIWGELFTWGNNNFGQLGTGNTTNINSPTKVTSLNFIDIADVSCGYNHTLIKTSTDIVYSAGDNGSNQLPINTNTDKTKFSVFHDKGFGTSFDNMAAGGARSYFNRDNKARVYGSNTAGQLGLGTKTSSENGVLMPFPFAIKGVATGGSGYAFLLVDESPSTFTASKGAFASKVTLAWSDVSSSLAGKDINIYRDGSLISVESMSSTSYTDLDAIPGKKHAYSLDINRTEGGKTIPISAIGWRRSNGIVKGNVLSLVGNQPVPDVNIKLKVTTVEGNFYYSTISDTKGNFRFDSVYYGALADVVVSASYQNHVFLIDTLKGVMDLTITSLGIGTFLDQTANLISGTVARLGGKCALDSIPVTLVKKYIGKADAEEVKYTNEDGNYSFSVNPFEVGLNTFELRLPKTTVKGKDTTKYLWDKNNVTVSKSIVNTNTPKQNFIDNISIPYQFSVKNSCANFPNTNFSIDIISEDGCFEKTITSNSNGVFPFTNLPPLKYIVSIASASPLTSGIVPVVEYLSVRPLKVDLSKYAINSKGDSTLKGLHFMKKAFVYHNIPTITLTKKGGIENVLCYPDILRVQGKGSESPKNAKVQFAVYEKHGVIECHVQEGFLVIKNYAATLEKKTIFFNDSLGKFPIYEFTPGLPATIAPYYKTIVVEYHTQTGFVSQNVYQVLIEGKAAQPGSDVIVDSEEGKDFQLPLAVLRDPPGDGSYSYIEKGVETNSTYTVSDEYGGSFTLKAEGAFQVFGIGLEVNASAGVGGRDGNSDVYSISSITSQRIETSAESNTQTSDANEYLVGGNADVIMGAGMALKYGVVESITYKETKAKDGSDSCYILKVSEIGISADKLKTTWIYNVAHIEALVREYTNALVLIRQGRLKVSGDNRDDSTFYKTLIANWNSVLQYHKRNTLPQYNLCDKQVLNNMFPNEGGLKNIAKSYQEDCFCKYAGQYVNNQFVLDTAFKWTNENIDRYRVARKAIDKLYQEVLVLNKNKNEYSLAVQTFKESNFSTLRSQLTDADKQYAENITFSGNTSIEKSFSKTFASSNIITQTVYVNSSLYAGVLAGAKLTIGTFIGLGGGATFSTETFDAEQRLGGEVTFDFTHNTESQESTSTTETSGYVLTDDDQGDQFSVTIIKGLQNNHTPYFELFAGRSSCPYEPGTLARDRPQLTLEYSDGTPFENNILRDIKENESAVYALKVSNLATEVFNEPRYYILTLGVNANLNGADVKTSSIGGLPVTFKVNSGSSLYTNLFVSKGPTEYKYNDIDMYIYPSCMADDADIPDGFNGAMIHLEAEFRKPCSGVSILTPSANWRINRSRDVFGNPSERLEVKIGDYDPENEYLQKISFEYRRVGSNIWKEAKELAVNKDSLQRYYAMFKSVYKDPVYTFVWDVFGKMDIIDGDYELRAVVHCGIEGKVESNIVRGKIDRTKIALFGTPKPTDGVLNIGENIEVLFNEPIECGYETKSNPHYQFTRKRDGAKLAFTPICNNNSIIYNFDGNLDSLDGEVLTMEVFDVEDLNGNKLSDTVNYEFIVSRTPVSWQPYGEYTVNIYKGESRLVNLSLINTGATKADIGLTKTGTPSGMLSLENANFSIFQNNEILVPIRINAINENIGTYTFTVGAAVSTFAKNYGTKNITIKVNVLTTPPVWTVPSGMPLSTVVICNVEIDSVRSIDTMDRIAITIDNEVRGFANIFKSKAGKNLYYAVINVQGSAADNNKVFKYRVWDANVGVEYDGKITGGDIKFDGGISGSTLNPRIIEVITKADSVKYIPLVKGWNWLAFNYQKTNMSVTNMLSGLNLSGGEILKSLEKEAIYNESSKTWFNTSSGLRTVNTADGYLLFLNRDDVLRISGEDANITSMVIQKGWNLIGNPFQKNKPINSVFQTNADLKNGAVLKTGGKNAKVSVLDGGLWTGSITEYETNRAYMLNNEKGTTLQYRSTDCDAVKRENFQYNLTILGSVSFDWAELQTPGDYVLAQIDGVCRGRGYIEEVNTPSRRFMLNMFVYGDSSDIGKTVTFKIYRQNKNEFYDAFTIETIKFTPDLHRGMPNNPFVFSNDKNYVSLDKITGEQIQMIDYVVYPNPFTNSFNVRLKAGQNGEANISVYDAMGKQVHQVSQICIAGINEFLINPSQLAAGIYTVRIILNGNVKTVKIIK